MIISQNNQIYFIWWSFHTLCCLTSSYFYVALAAFPNTSEILMNINNVYEVIFCLHIILSFFVDYYERGANEPVNDLTKIAKNYLKT